MQITNKKERSLHAWTVNIEGECPPKLSMFCTENKLKRGTKVWHGHSGRPEIQGPVLLKAQPRLVTMKSKLLQYAGKELLSSYLNIVK